MFDFFYNRDKCRKPGFLRGDIYTSCISMVLLDHFTNKSNTFLSLSSLSSSPISSHILLGSPFPPIPDSRIAQSMVPWRSLFRLLHHFELFWIHLFFSYFGIIYFNLICQNKHLQFVTCQGPVM